MMLFVIEGEIRSDAAETLSAVRLEHLEFVSLHRNTIRFAGPARNECGVPEAMIMVIEKPTLEAANAFINLHPFVASGRVFSSVKVREWMQVLPEGDARWLTNAIADERLRRQGVAD